MKEEKTPGRRRSASRKISNSNPDLSPDFEPDPGPEPSQDRLDPEPEPDPPPDPDPSPNPVPAEESRSSSPLLLASSSGEEPGVSPRPSYRSPDLRPLPEPELEGGGCSPALSPCPSPLEDEDSLSPLFHRSLSEDSGGSPTPSLGHTQQR